MKLLSKTKSILSFLEEKYNFEFQKLDFRFPIEVLDELLKNFFKDFNEESFLVQANSDIKNLQLKKISRSYLLQVPLSGNEQLYIGLSDLFSFLILFDETDISSNGTQRTSRFFLTFEPSVINFVFNYFYKNHCKSLPLKEKKLLIKLKNIKTNHIDPFNIGKFQESLLVKALSNNNKVSKAKIVEAISFANESIIVTDLAFNIQEVNKSFENTYVSSKVKKITDIVSKDIIDDAISTLYRNNSYQAEIKVKQDKKEKLMLLSCYFFKDEIQRPSGFVFTLKDLTHLKRLDDINKKLILKLRERNLQLSEVNKRLLEADRIRTDLLSVVNHELRTPVSTIIGFSELIAERDYDKNTIKTFANKIKDSANYLNGLISNYLDLACNQFGIDSGNLVTSPVNLTELLRVCYQEEKYKFPEIKFNFYLDCLGYEPIIFTEAENVKKLFSNLLNNALKYSPNGGNISVKILNDGDNVTVSVSDEGVGLTLDQARQVFEPFYRTDNSLTRDFKGIGLGLAVCKRIVELYHGSIWCEGGLESGTVFYVTLPVNPHKIREQKIESREQKIENKVVEIRDYR